MYPAKSHSLRTCFLILCIVMLAAFTMMLAGCGNTPALPDPPGLLTPLPHVPALTDDAVRKIADDPNVKAVAAANNDFGFRLLAQLDKGQAGKNVFFSPLSLSSALMMARNGAAGQTAYEMAKTLGIGSASQEDVNTGYDLLLPYLRNPDDKVELSIANALWVRQYLHFNPSYQSRCEQNYGAQTTSLDLGSQSGIDVINSWVNQNTHGKIPTIIDSADPGTVVILTDAIYFHGKWTNPFEKTSTQQAPFTSEGGGTKQVPMMSQEHEFAYTETPQFQAITLPYGSERVRMCILLPKSGTSAGDLAGSLNKQSWDHLMTQFTSQDVQLYLPRFHADYNASLAGTLESLGMVAPFSSQADFTPMGFQGASISYVLHKATLDVDEEGTVAAAATAIGMTEATAVMSTKQPIVMRVDHPFFCAIRDDTTETILFEGVIRDPE